MEFAGELTGEKLKELLQQATRSVGEMGNEAEQIKALERLVPRLGPETMGKALSICRRLHSRPSAATASILRVIALSCAEPERSTVFEEALNALKSEFNEDRAATELAFLSIDLPVSLMEEALELIAHFKDKGNQLEGLRHLMPRLPRHLIEKSNAVFQLATLSVASLVSARSIAPTVTSLVSARSFPFVSALVGEETMPIMGETESFLSTLDAMTVQREIARLVEDVDPGAREAVSRVLLGEVSEPQLTTVLEAAMETIKKLPEGWIRWKLLANIAPQIPESMLDEFRMVVGSFPTGASVLADEDELDYLPSGFTRPWLFRRMIVPVSIINRLEGVAGVRACLNALRDNTAWFS
jgi:hypothetical protein